jgi:hypothetical protein
MENRGKNKDFTISGVLMILKRNYNIILEDYQDIDTSISISENLTNILKKHKIEMQLNEIIDYV